MEKKLFLNRCSLTKPVIFLLLLLSTRRSVRTPSELNSYLPLLLDHKSRHHWSPARWAMRQVSDMTVVVVGMGAIGQECARRFTEVGARVIGVNRSRKQVDAVAELYLAEEIVEAASGLRDRKSVCRERV